MTIQAGQIVVAADLLVCLNANGSAKTSVIVPAARTLTAGAGLTGGGTLAANRTMALDLDADNVWTGDHTFQGTTTTHSLIPEATDAYDLGTSSKLYRKAYISELDALLFAQDTITIIGSRMSISKNSGALAEPVGAIDTTVDFGQAMTPNDWVELRGLGQVEYMLVGALVSGTRYNVTRNVDGSGANVWAQGAPYRVNGQAGDGRIELVTESGVPTIALVKQGATYNTITTPVVLDTTGLKVLASTTTWTALNAARFVNAAGDTLSGVYGLDLAASEDMQIATTTQTGKNSSIDIHPVSDNGKHASVSLTPEQAAGTPYATVDVTTDGPKVSLSGSTGFYVEIVGGLNLGAAAGAVIGSMALKEISAPSAPAADMGLLFMDVSGGKSRLCVQFQSGAAQVLATEP